MQVTWHPEAESEVVEAAAFYNRRVPGLGADFLDSVDAAVARIVDDPSRFAGIEEDIRRCRVKRFPYCIYFRRLTDTIRILVVKHHSRAPAYWRSRR
ncbi:MAG: type II toxin-antitoxin system RelE/ParE family toxin [Patescibacteria group bacterium]|nr:type II toxin-antitoxin system RelE/ParE family toxin [Patescibacteria group bacterium]